MGLFDSEKEEFEKARNPKKNLDGFSEGGQDFKDDLPSEGGLFSNSGDNAVSFDDIGFDDEKPKQTPVQQEGSGKRYWEDVMKDIFSSGFKMVMDIISNVINSSIDENINSFRNLAIICGILTGLSGALWFVGQNNESVLFVNMGYYFGLGSFYNVLAGIFVICMMMIISYKPAKQGSIEKVVEAVVEEKEEELNEEVALENDYKKSMDDIMREVLGDDYVEEDNNDDSDDDNEEENESSSNSGSPINWEEDDDDNEDKPIEVDVNAGGLMNRQALYNTFKSIYPTNNSKFAQIVEIDKDDDRFKDMQIIIEKAIAKEMGKEISDIANETGLIYLKDSTMCIEMKFKQPKKKLKASAVESSINNYSNDIMNLMVDPKNLYPDNPECNTVSARVEVDGDYFNIIISKPNKNAILVGDLLKNEKVEEFICGKANYPVIFGVNELGQPIMEDVKNLYAGMIGGKPRGGKSWFTMSMLSQLATFNSPEDIQFVLADPKSTPLFKSLGTLPHTAGLIMGDKPKDTLKYIKMLNDLNTKESERRAKILQEAGCDSIWDYRKKGGKMPLLFVFMDEYMTIKSNAKMVSDNHRNVSVELDNLLSQMITRLPYVGIFVHLISHTFTGIVVKEARLNTAFRTVVKSDDLMKEVFEKTELASFTKKLVQNGDCAIKIGGESVKYMRSLGFSLSDEDNSRRIREIAKAYYRMNATIPDMTSIGSGYTRNEQEIHDDLFGNEEDNEDKILRI